MKTGVDLLENDKFTPIQIDFLRKTVAIMKVLTEEAMNSAEKFTKSCGSNFLIYIYIYALIYLYTNKYKKFRHKQIVNEKESSTSDPI